MAAIEYSSKHKKIAALLSCLEVEARSIDGFGNNVDHPTWGQAETQLLRLLPAVYGDGLSQPAGGIRPSAREISNELCAQVFSGGNKHKLSAFFWLMGQFVDHALDLSKDTEDHFDIEVPTGDFYFDPSSTGTATINLKRTNFDPTTGTSNERQQINSITSFLDASSVYGSDEKRACALRSFKDGLLKTGEGDMMPANGDNLPNAAPHGPMGSIYLAGDIRGNEHLGLAAMHTIWVREHNYWARLLKKKFAHIKVIDDNYDQDEEIFKRARAIVEAELQIITYNEFLPLLLGEHLDEYDGYKKEVNPSVANSFATAAYRFGHTMVSSDYPRLDECGHEYDTGNLKLRQAFFATYKLANEGGMEPILRGFAKTQSEEPDGTLVNDLRNFLFGPPGAGGHDLAALNIQRGREHGLPDFNSFRQLAGQPALTSFADLTDDVEIQGKLQALYGDVDNIDLWMGGLLEKGDGKSLLGPTFTYIIKEQFTRIRDGDRFWYQNQLPTELVELLEKVKLGDIIDRNTKIDEFSGKDVFHV